MSQLNSSSNSRYILYLDILGFTALIESKSAAEIYAVIEEALKAFGRWEDLNQQFRTIYFSDTFVFYQEPKGYGDWAFLDIYAIGGMILSALLAKGIPARGAIAFGEFEVVFDASGRHQVYFGKALVEAYQAEKRENWIGIVILPSAWKPYELNNPGSISAYANEKVWERRADDVLLLNPFIKLRSSYSAALIDEVTKPYSQWNAPEFPNDILAFKFLRDQADHFALKHDYTSSVAAKYHTTIRFLQSILGSGLYQWGVDASLPGNF